MASSIPHIIIIINNNSYFPKLARLLPLREALLTAAISRGGSCP